MTELTEQQISFLKKHKISIGSVFNAKDRAVKENGEAPVPANKTAAAFFVTLIISMAALTSAGVEQKTMVQTVSILSIAVGLVTYFWYKELEKKWFQKYAAIEAEVRGSQKRH